MLDFGWMELLVIIALAIIFIGPKELPALMVALGRVVRRVQYIKFAISQQFEDVMHSADLDDIRKSVNFEDKDIQNHDAPIEDASFDEAETEECVNEGEKHG